VPNEKVKSGCLGQILALFVGAKPAHFEPELPFARVSTLLSPAERSFVGVLERALAGRPVIVAIKVRLGDLVKVEQGAKNRQGAVNKVTGKHVDFVTCRADTTEPLVAIELDDKSHARAGRVERDRFLDACLAAAGVPLVRVPAARGYSVSELQAAIVTHVERSPQ